MEFFGIVIFKMINQMAVSGLSVNGRLVPDALYYHLTLQFPRNSLPWLQRFVSYETTPFRGKTTTTTTNDTTAAFWKIPKRQYCQTVARKHACSQPDCVWTFIEGDQDERKVYCTLNKRPAIINIQSVRLHTMRTSITASQSVNTAALWDRVCRAVLKFIAYWMPIYLPTIRRKKKNEDKSQETVGPWRLPADVIDTPNQH